MRMLANRILFLAMRNKTITGIILFTVMILTAASSNAQDTLRLMNGDILHGEIKSLNKSILIMETDYSDSDFKIEWNEIAEITSGRMFTILLSSKEKIYSRFKNSEKEGYTILVYNDTMEREVSINEIVIIEEIQNSFADRFNASISSGFTVTKANNSKQFSLRANASYHAKSWKLSGNFNDVRSTQDEVEPVERIDASVNFQYLFYKNWYAGINNEFLSNTEQQIDLRSTQTLSIGNMIVRNNKLYLSASSGLTLNREKYSNETEVFNSREGFLGAEFNAYDIGDLNVLTTFYYYPGITENDRNRVNFSIDLKYDFPLDFFIKFGYTLNYDNKPPNNGAQSDYVFQTTLGWEF